MGYSIRRGNRDSIAGSEKIIIIKSLTKNITFICAFLHRTQQKETIFSSTVVVFCIMPMKNCFRRDEVKKRTSKHISDDILKRVERIFPGNTDNTSKTKKVNLTDRNKSINAARKIN